MISFAISREDWKGVHAIVERANAAIQVHPWTALDLEMDRVAVHANGCPLDFPKLLAADEFNFNHDICGIRRHLDRETGKLGDCFLPRCAAKEA